MAKHQDNLTRKERSKLAPETASGKPPTPKPQSSPQSPAINTLPETENHHTLRRFLARGSSLLLAAVAIAGFTIGAWPHVQVFPSNEPAVHASSVPFTFRNTGHLPIYDLEIQCAPQNVTAIDTKLNATIEWNVSIGNGRMIAEKVLPGEDKPLNCKGFGIGDLSQINSADMPVLVRFRPIPFIPLSWPTISRVFATSRQPDGRLQWQEDEGR